ncbi:CPCC family cysteine-rich protein [Streptomyces sp. B1866]|uniref:CPCC family cysteine-rich protein n=1 Tax=Streptomyces sp. B1866 TaxID=3075431 RepID=UPI00288D9288|nr:CPCC family cysteine-rich protein [Streptomyces sp. B1866]MDT3395094.1 CPCC family cysteine-rich protein [Streptomyces sp. B1866]
MGSYPCHCCGRLVHDAPPGSYQICPVCGWEDDLIQLRWPQCESGANRLSLIEAQRLYRRRETADHDLALTARTASAPWPIDVGFRPADPEVDNFEPTRVMEADWPEDRTLLYWWRPRFWRRPEGCAGSER